MGWKTSALLLEAPMGTDAACFIGGLLGEPYEIAGQESLEEAFFPEATYVGEHGGATLILDPQIPVPILMGGSSPVLDRLAERHPDARIAAVQLHSVTSYYAFRIFRGNEPRRALMGSADNGVMLDEGEPLPFERHLLERYEQHEEDDGTMVWVDEDGESWEHDQLGEERVFGIFQEMMGCRPDQDEAMLQMPVTLVKRSKNKKVGFFRRLFGWGRSS